jgi:tRNA(adenine34) deaminase
MRETNNNIDEHERFMHLAISEAKIAADYGDVPIGAVIVLDNEVIAKGYNRVELDNNALHHAEIMAINSAIESIGYKHLLDSSIYVTLEPCPMCAGAIVLSRIPKIIYGAKDPKAGASHSLYSITSDDRLNHRCEVISGVLEKECSAILSNFFKDIRKKKNAISG